MKITLEFLNNFYQINTDFGWNLAIPLAFNRQQPNHFDADQASSKVMQAGGFVGNTEQGGSCNVNELTLNPHCNGTHTETIAHICDFSAPLSQMISKMNIPALMPCVLITITPELGQQSCDSYSPDFACDDLVITCAALKQALNSYDNAQLAAVLIRTLPNELDKQTRHYNQDAQPPFLSREAILYLNERGVEHLLVDMPSIDRLHDDGLMSCHHLFWQVPARTHQPSANSLYHKTVTEMIYVDNQLVDGFYFLNLQTPAFVNDAAPSRPVLYGVEKIAKQSPQKQQQE